MLISEITVTNEIIKVSLGTGECVTLPFSTELLIALAPFVGVKPTLAGYNSIANLTNRHGASEGGSVCVSTLSNDDAVAAASFHDILEDKITSLEVLIGIYPELSDLLKLFPSHSEEYIIREVNQHIVDMYDKTVYIEYRNGFLFIKSNAYSSAVNNLAYVPYFNLLLLTYRSGTSLYGKYLSSHYTDFAESVLDGRVSIGTEIKSLSRYKAVDITSYESDDIFGITPKNNIFDDLEEAESLED